MTIAEIPTGAIADLLGKRKTLIASFFFNTICGFAMAFSTNLQTLLVSVFVGGIGGSLFSGTLDSLVFDTLKERKEENEYDKVSANINSINLIAPAVCSIIGGAMYYVSPKLPFLANGIAYLIAFGITFFLEEPKIDSIKFSFHSFVSQTRMGIKQLFKTDNTSKQTMILLSVGVIVVILDEMLNSFLGVEFGFNEQQAGVIWAVTFIISAIITQATPIFLRKFGSKSTSIVVGLIIAFTLVISPWVGLIVGGTAILLRSAFQSMFSTLTSVAVNNATESKYRATTISTFNMIKNIPYVCFAFMIGSLSGSYSAKWIALVLGLILLVLISLQSLSRPKVLSNNVY